MIRSPSLDNSPPLLSAPIAVLDAARQGMLRVVVGIPVLRHIAISRDRRVALTALAGVSMALVMASTVPLLLLLLGPVILGVPHLAADVRYLLLRRPAATPIRRGALGLIAVFIATSVVGVVVVGPTLASIEVGLGAGGILLGVAAALLLARPLRSPRLLWALPFAGLACLSLAYPRLSRAVMLHGHNIVALVLWGVLFRRSLRVAWAPLLFVALGVVWLAFGVVQPAPEQFGVDFFTAASWLVPHGAFEFAVPIVSVYAFLQAVHYGVWLGWIPQEDLKSEGTISFRMSLRGWFKDFTPLGLAAIVVASLAVIVGAGFDMVGARRVYLSVATFHGYFELAMLGFLLIAGRRRER